MQEGLARGSSQRMHRFETTYHHHLSLLASKGHCIIAPCYPWQTACFHRSLMCQSSDVPIQTVQANANCITKHNISGVLFKIWHLSNVEVDLYETKSRSRHFVPVKFLFNVFQAVIAKCWRFLDILDIHTTRCLAFRAFLVRRYLATCCSRLWIFVDSQMSFCRNHSSYCNTACCSSSVCGSPASVTTSAFMKIKYQHGKLIYHKDGNSLFFVTRKSDMHFV